METALKHAGSCGRYQVCHVVFTQMPRFVSVWAVFLMMLGSYNPGWRCVEYVSNASVLATTNPEKLIYQETSKNLSHDDKSYQVYEQNWDNENLTESDIYNGTCDKQNFCKKIEFNPGSVTIVTEFELICDKVWIVRFIFISLGLGYIIGSFVGGLIGERYGRKKGLYSFTLVMCLFSGLATLSSHWIMYAVCSFFISCGIHGVLTLANVFSMEVLNSKWRGYFGAVPVWTLSLLIFTIISKFIRNWVYIHFITFALCLTACTGFFVVPDSPRWLAVNGKTEEAKKAVRKISRINRKTNPNLETLESLYSDDITVKSRYSYLDMLRTRELRTLSLKLCLTMGIFPMGYYTLGYGIQSLPGDFYINAIVSSCCDMVILILAGILCNQIGRRWTGVIMAAMGAICCCNIIVVLFAAGGQAQSFVILISTFLAKGGSHGIYIVSQLFIVELFPTAVRNVATGLARCASGIGSLLAPFLIPSSDGGNSFVVCFSILCLCFLTELIIFTTLPETNKQALKDEIPEKEIPITVDEDKEKLSTQL